MSSSRKRVRKGNPRTRNHSRPKAKVKVKHLPIVRMTKDKTRVRPAKVSRRPAKTDPRTTVSLNPSKVHRAEKDRLPPIPIPSNGISADRKAVRVKRIKE